MMYGQGGFEGRERPCKILSQGAMRGIQGSGLIAPRPKRLPDDERF